MKKVLLHSMISGTYKVTSNTELVVKKDADIIASRLLSDYLEGSFTYVDACNNELGRTLFYACGEENIVFRAEKNGVINGQGLTWLSKEDFSKRPGLIEFIDCKNITIQDLTLIDSPVWAIRMHNCENVLIEDINIVSKFNQNNDGIVLDCCRNVVIRNCMIDTDDDSIAIKATKNIPTDNIVIENCYLQSMWSNLKIGAETVGDISNVRLSNCKVGANNCGCLLKIVPTDGSQVKNVMMNDVDVEMCFGPIFIANGERRSSFFRGESRVDYSTITGITLKRISIKKTGYGKTTPSSNAKGCVVITGTKKNKIKDVLIEDCSFTLPGGINREMGYNGRFYFAEMKKQYPEYYTLGTAPACGAFIRHADNVVLRNNRFNIEEEDCRKVIVTADVTDYVEE